MRLLKRFAFGLIIIVALLAIIGMFLPRNIEVARSIEIDAPASKIFPQFATLKNTVPWSPWLHHDPNTKLSFSDQPSGVGASMTWASDHQSVGSGTMTITDERVNEHLTVALDFGDMGGGTATWDLVETDGKTMATWGMQTDMGAGPIGRWMGLMMDGWIGADYELGLENLKALVEG